MIDDASERWKELPLLEASPEQQRPVIARVDQILAPKQNNPLADISAWEKQLTPTLPAFTG